MEQSMLGPRGLNDIFWQSWAKWETLLMCAVQDGLIRLCAYRDSQADLFCSVIIIISSYQTLPSV